MTSIDYSHILTKAVEELSDSRSYEGLYQQHKEGDPLPSSQSLQKIVELTRAILFLDTLAIPPPTNTPFLTTLE